MSDQSAGVADLRINVTDEDQQADTRVMRVEGEIDVFTAPRLKTTIAGIIDAGCSTLIIDLQQVRYIDSSGLAVLVGALKRMQGRSGTIRLVLSNPQVKKVFEITGLTRIFPTFDSVERAKADLIKPAFS